ncbi:cysteine peptidase family C39 domain-containing protein [Niabella beijingensis]|uniref:cysteine peptidase family C39 domain-containing protein n=1 Tax=Niabella beijingensis TaxID=2872700 RepID=UPI001CBF5D81|nr:cysteine peptidase family C39 domain-containing protein [Niabella beijingensis]MBZ4187681.1 hypothetical protein [Niabella beijingensis]
MAMSLKSVPMIYQRHKKDCGPACVCMVAQFYGKECTLEAVVSFCNVTDKGITMSALQAAIEKLGLESVIIKCTIGDLYEVPLPAIVLWNRRHFVVLCEASESSFKVLDPTLGEKNYSYSMFAKGWERSVGYGIVVAIENSDY